MLRKWLYNKEDYGKKIKISINNDQTKDFSCNGML